MSISRKVFDNGTFKKARYDIKEHPVILLLSRNQNLAFTHNEIEKRVKLNKFTVRSMTNSLKKKGKIIHKSPYYAWKIVKKKAPVKKTKKKK